MVKSPRARGKKPPLPKPQTNKSQSQQASPDPATAVGNTTSSPQGGGASTTRKTPAGLPPGVLGNSNFAVIPRRQTPDPDGKGKGRQEKEDITAEDNPNLYVATPGSGSSSRKDLVFYTNCERGSDEFRRTLPQEYIDLVFSSMAKFCPTLIPTTFEAAAEYLREEKLKPKGKRDLRREFCYLSFTKIQESVGRPTLFLLETQTLIAVGPGHSIAVPTIDCPPWAFDRERNNEPSIFLFDPATKKPLDATAIMTYFTNTDPNQKHAFDEKETNIIQYKGRMYE
ncbi:hypothetical protein M407DRAFT_246858 [Tulasnella calospora MUT 4182]|uniref:Uncharacterized protein n=1 Tax=Tulasnella calospora MUT 4182 TaxID=1051891 RepID=A0A0C3PQZ2_9AGAM|nr:hypothetical protein M407DRAFT_246858 [Tulasnella calospora MUT 4182]